MIRKICVITGTRADYGLLYWLMKEIAIAPELELQLVVTGMHLSPEFGLTYKVIESDFSISKKIEMLMSSDTAIGISKSMGLAQISFSEAFSELEPDIVVILGDRYEVFAAAAAAMIARIPIAHLHGGEITEGVIDEAIRHSITKMSHLHFTATEEYRKRVIQLGEKPDTVRNVGGLGIDNIKKLKLLTADELQQALAFRLEKKNILVTFHPVTLEVSTGREQFQAILNALEGLKETKIIFTKANSDTDGRVINEMIDKFVVEHTQAVAFVSLGQLKYLSTLKYMDAVVGNSSSGLLEAPSFQIGTINIGDRQKGRVKAASVIDCQPFEKDIHKAFELLYSQGFQSKLRGVKNPYGSGGASKKIVDVLRTVKIESIIKKTFRDIGI
ncbi:MAG: UDP-N-acetylglucosamine 2-epimerase (hydrolyzing) [Piscirickettsiaceae bacterium]|jgi:GDP/UDP-N,N'-diacetylbacillosamine 2-epimerase (hydrolysing)|nr:UDP-N-acetylglucosamine 2-epimerase (hydrolyzing) [Piscirickettsiaceae bacterium]